MNTLTNESAELEAEFMAMVEKMTPDELDRLYREGCVIAQKMSNPMAHWRHTADQKTPVIHNRPK